MMNMETACNNTSDNGVNGTGATNESASSGMEVGGQQPSPGRHQATTSLKWNKEVNKIVIKRFYKSNPKKRGYRLRMFGIWKEMRVFEISEQRLADQARAIKLNEWLSEVELEEIRREVSQDIQGGATVANSEEVENQEGFDGEGKKQSDTENDNDRGHEISSEEMSTEEVIADMEKGGCSI